jgi:hypothetical protein
MGLIMKIRQCFRCGKGLSPGSLTYVAHIRIVADFDGVILEPEENIDDQLKQMIEQIQDEDPEELEKEVYEEFTLVLCKSCRDRFVDETRHPWEGPFRIQKGTGGFIQ